MGVVMLSGLSGLHGQHEILMFPGEDSFRFDNLIPPEGLRLRFAAFWLEEGQIWHPRDKIRVNCVISLANDMLYASSMQV